MIESLKKRKLDGPLHRLVPLQARSTTGPAAAQFKSNVAARTLMASVAPPALISHEGATEAEALIDPGINRALITHYAIGDRQKLIAFHQAITNGIEITPGSRIKYIPTREEFLKASILPSSKPTAKADRVIGYDSVIFDFSFIEGVA